LFQLEIALSGLTWLTFPAMFVALAMTVGSPGLTFIGTRQVRGSPL
jgi:hypothetical protein